MTTSFFDRLAERIAAVDSVVSVGLDPDPDRLPETVADADLPRWAFNRRIVDATHEHAACYKPNAAFYEGPDGWRALRETIAYAHGKGVPVLLDAKRADIGNTARQYASVLDDPGDGGLGADAITVNPYLGRDALEPFLQRGAAGVFVLCRTSNSGGADLQDLALENGEPLYERVAALADLWNRNDNVGLVVGATAPEELEEIREAVPGLPFLVPGVGAQGGDAEAAVEFGLAEWKHPVEGDGPAGGGDGETEVAVGLVNSLRGIIFAGEGARDPDRYFDAAGAAARDLKGRLNQFR
ncbi:MAG: orotidine-5'-phosphate decarboxylase [Haloarculaceae archaeon]